MNRSLIFQILLAGMLMISASPAYSGEPREDLVIVPASGDSFWVVDKRPSGEAITEALVDGKPVSFLARLPDKEEEKKHYVAYAPGLTKEEVIISLKSGQDVVVEKKVRLSKDGRGLAKMPYIKDVTPKVVREGEMLTVKGVNLGDSLENLNLYIANYQELQPVSLSQPDDRKEQTASFRIPANSSEKAGGFLKGRWLSYSDAYVFVQVNANTPDRMNSNGAFIDVVISSAIWWFAAMSLIVTGFIFALPVALCLRYDRKFDPRAGILATVLMDKKTNTYSLSKFQALLWTAVIVWSYLFLAIGKSVLVGKAVMPDINASLLGVIGISFAGLITARGLGNMYPKNERVSAQPRFADIFSENNEINLTRLQLFVFTIVGAMVYVYYSVNPDFFATGLTDIPVQLNALLAVSQGGYLGGKLTGNVAVNYVLPRRVNRGKVEEIRMFGTGFVDGTKIIIQGMADYINASFINQNTLGFVMPAKIIDTGLKQIVIIPPTGTSFVLENVLEVIDVKIKKKLVLDASGKQAMDILFDGVVLGDEPVSAFLGQEMLVFRKQEANLYRLERPEGLALDSVVTITTKDASFAVTTAVNEINDFKFA